MFASKLNVFLLCFLLNLMLPGSLGQSDSDWDYNDPDSWAESYPGCGGSSQSPVNREDDKVNDKGFTQTMYMRNYEKAPSSMTAMNTGHSVVVTADWPDDDDIPYFGGGHQINSFQFHRAEFHWSSQCLNGSEHTVNGKGRCLEAELIHYNTDIKSFEESANSTRGRAIVSLSWVEYKQNSTRNNALNAIISVLPDIVEPGSEIDITPFPLSDFAWDMLRGYFTYKGSMTTPPCDEGVMWIFPITVDYIGTNAIEVFRTIKLNGGTNHNIRPTQPLGDRQILRYY